jgi:hypothetical protein
VKVRPEGDCRRLGGRIKAYLEERPQNASGCDRLDGSDAEAGRARSPCEEFKGAEGP